MAVQRRRRVKGTRWMEDATCSAKEMEVSSWVLEVCVILAFGEGTEGIMGWGWCGCRRMVDDLTILY